MDYRNYLSQLKQTVPFTYSFKDLYEPALKQTAGDAMEKISSTSFLNALHENKAQLLETNDKEIKFHKDKIIAHTGQFLNSIDFVKRPELDRKLFIGVRGLSVLYGLELLKFLNNEDYVLLKKIQR